MRKRRRFFIFLVAILSFFVIVILSHQFFSPPDWVEMNLEQVPADVTTIYPIAKDQGKVFPLNWYFAKVFPFLGSAKQVGEVWYLSPRVDRRRGDLQWVSADSYGILAQFKSGHWVVWWLRPEDIDGPSPWRYLFGGGEPVTIRVIGSESAVDAPKSLLDQVETENP